MQEEGLPKKLRREFAGHLTFTLRNSHIVVPKRVPSPRGTYKRLKTESFIASVMLDGGRFGPPPSTLDDIRRNLIYSIQAIVGAAPQTAANLLDDVIQCRKELWAEIAMLMER